MSAESDVVLAVSRRLLEANGEHPEPVHVKEELARMFLESQKIVQELRDERLEATDALVDMIFLVRNTSRDEDMEQCAIEVAKKYQQDSP